MAEKKKFTPNWYDVDCPPNSYRSLLKWGGVDERRHPNSGLAKLVMDTFHMTEEDFKKPVNLSTDAVKEIVPIQLDERHLEAMRTIVGAGNVRTDTYERIKHSYGKGMLDAMRLRRKVLENLADAIVAPRNNDDIRKILAYANENLLPVYIFGGGSSVTRGLEATKTGSIMLDMSKHMTKVLNFNEIDQTITVQAGIQGPDLERILNNAPKEFGAKRRYTLGHFPQSFDHSSLGGWIVTRGAGQNSTYYGKIEDMVIAQHYITPTGEFQTCPQPAAATGPDFDQVMMGGEGSFGVLTEATMRLCRYMPENRRKFSYMFKNWEDAQAAAREVMQGEFGFPSVFRLSDPEETDVMMHTYHIADSPADAILKKLGYKPNQKCLFLGFSDGELGFSINIDHKLRKIFKAHGAFELSFAHVTEAWEKGRFTDPHYREDLMDFGILIDTLECSVTWSQMPEVHRKVREYVKSRPDTICMTHLSHAYPQGANLYFIFIAKMDTMREFLDLQYGILEAITKAGAAVSHHHGVGKTTAMWLEEQIGKEQMDVIRVLKKHFDPNNIMNPGGTLGLDMDEAQQSREWSKDLEG